MAQLNKKHDLYFSVIFGFIFSSMFVFTNFFDWDFVFTTLEVDLRSFVLEGKFPSWSHQFCAGSTRSGDPQSFGLSPLMIVPILFGSFWGAKILLLIASIVGIYYTVKLIRFIDDEINYFVITTLLSSFFLGNFFLFHFSEGHLAFTSYFYAFPLLYIWMKFIHGSGITIKDFALNTIFLFLLLTGSFYQPSVYFVLPLAISSLFFLLIQYKQIKNWQHLIGIIISSVTAVVLSLYRLLPAFDYQKLFPRTLNTIEFHGPIDQILFFLTPIHNRRFLIPSLVPDFSAGEDSYFSSLTVTCCLIVIFRFRSVLSYFRLMTPLKKFSLCLIFTGVLLSLGNPYSFTPFGLLNKVFNGSLRVSSRYNFMTYLGLFFILIDYMRFSKLWHIYKKWISGFMLLTSISCLFQHYYLKNIGASFDNLVNIINLIPNYEDKMQYVFISKATDNLKSYMYSPTMLGFAVANCYQPMHRKTYLTGQMYTRNVPMFTWHFMQNEKQTQTRDCLEQSYFTQSEIFISKSCLPNSKIHLNFIEDRLVNKFNIRTTEEGYFLP